MDLTIDTPTKDLVSHYNSLVVANHPTLAQLTEWKASKAALIAKIKALPATPAKANREDALAATTAGLKAKAEAATPAPKVTKEMDAAINAPLKGKKEKAKEKVAKKGQSDPEVSAYFAANDLNPKIVRAKLRRAGFKAPYTLDQIKGLNKKD